MSGESMDGTDPTRYRIHSGPYETESEARKHLKDIRGMVDKFEDGWYVLEMYYVDADTK